MSSVHELLSEINLPKMVHVKQRFDAEQILDVEEMIQEKFTQHEVQNDIRKNMKIAIAVGSRGIDRIHLIVKAVVSQLKRYGAQPFVVPAMGSHGGATAEGQIEILKYLGVEEETVGCPIVSSMSVTQVGKLDNGLLVWMDKAASEADGIVVINRIKPHSAFSGDYESGLVKMISVGLGKQKGAESCHTLGFQYMTKSIVEMANVCLRKKPILFGVAIIENAYDKVKDIIIVPSKNIIDLEKKLLLEAKRNMPKLLIFPIDVLIIDQMGKEFSGSGIDPNITGRASTPWFTGGPEPKRMIVLDITNKSLGNASGIGLADVTTKKVFDKMNFESTYANVLTATTIQSAKIPIIMESDKLAIQAAVKASNLLKSERARIVRIKNTLSIQEIQVSESMIEDVKKEQRLTILGKAVDMQFDKNDNFEEIGSWNNK